MRSRSTCSLPTRRAGARHAPQKSLCDSCRRAHVAAQAWRPATDTAKPLAVLRAHVWSMVPRRVPWQCMTACRIGVVLCVSVALERGWRGRNVHGDGIPVRPSCLYIISTMAKYTSERSRNVQIRSSVIYQAANGSPKRLPMAPRTVLGPGYTGWCLACLEAAVVSTGGRSRTPPVGSRRARRTAHSTLQQAIVALASRRLSQSFPPQAVWQAWTARYGRALPSRREQGEPLSRRRRVPREGPLGHVVRRRGASE